MASFIQAPTGAPGTGFFPGHSTVQVINRSGSTVPKGVVVAIDFYGDAAESTEWGTGNSTDHLANAVACTAGGALRVALGKQMGILGLVVDDIADDAEGTVLLFGRGKALAGAAVSAEDPLEVNTANSRLRTAATVGAVTCAVAESAASGGGVLFDVFFNGYAALSAQHAV